MNFHVSRYQGSKNWLCAIEPSDRSWTMFVDVDNRPTVYLNETPPTQPEPSDPKVAPPS